MHTPHLDEGGHPLETGWYGNLRHLADKVLQMFSEYLSARIDQLITVRFTHDGTAASLVYAGQAKTACITLGTALGWGIAPASTDGLRSFADHFFLSETN